MKGTINEGLPSRAVWQQWRRNIAKTKHMTVGILHKFYTVIYFKFKLQLHCGTTKVAFLIVNLHTGLRYKIIYLTLYTRCRTNQYCYNRVRLYLKLEFRFSCTWGVGPHFWYWGNTKQSISIWEGERNKRMEEIAKSRGIRWAGPVAHIE